MFAVEVNFEAYRNAPFGGASGVADFVEWGVDLSAAAFRMEIREAPGGTGPALVTLTDAAVDAEGIHATLDMAYYHPVAGVQGMATVIRPFIAEATMQGLPAAAPARDDKVLYYDLHITVPGLPKQVYFYGTFTVKPGVTL